MIMNYKLQVPYPRDKWKILLSKINSFWRNLHFLEKRNG